MLTLCDGSLAIEEKGIYSIEKFIIARRLMYWQVYLHKTVIAAENLIINIMRRAKELAAKNVDLFASPPLRYFLYQHIDKKKFKENPLALQQFALLDDHDIMGAIKVWCQHPDPLLADLSQRLIYRKLYKIEIQNEPFREEDIEKIKHKLIKKYPLLKKAPHYYLFQGIIQNNAYNPLHHKINILKKNGQVYDIADAADLLNIWALSEPVTKYFLCTPEKIIP